MVFVAEAMFGWIAAIRLDRRDSAAEDADVGDAIDVARGVDDSPAFDHQIVTIGCCEPRLLAPRYGGQGGGKRQEFPARDHALRSVPPNTAPVVTSFSRPVRLPL